AEPRDECGVFPRARRGPPPALGPASARVRLACALRRRRRAAAHRAAGAAACPRTTRLRVPVPRARARAARSLGDRSSAMKATPRGGGFRESALDALLVTGQMP